MEECNGELSVSMEIEPLDTQLSNETGNVIINEFIFQGITILGLYNPPAMQGAKIKTFSKNNIKIEIEQMIKEYSAEKGGEIVEEKDKVFENEDVVETTDEENIDETTEESEVFEDESNEEEVVEEVTEEGEYSEEQVEEPSEEFTKLQGEYEQLKQSYAELEESYNQLSERFSEYESIVNAQADYSELKAFKEEYDRAKYESEVEEVAQMFGLKAEEVEELKSKALNKEITVEQFKEKLALKYAMNQLAKKPKVEDNSSEMSIIDEDEVELSNKPYGGYFEKYKNKK